MSRTMLRARHLTQVTPGEETAQRELGLLKTMQQRVGRLVPALLKPQPSPWHHMPSSDGTLGAGLADATQTC